MSTHEDALPRDEDPAEAAALWCMRLSDGDMSEEEWRAFEIWLAEPGHDELVQDAAAIWHASEAIGEQPEIIALRSQALTSYRKAGHRRWLAVEPGRLRRFGALAAMLLLAFTAILFWYGTRPDEYATGIGERQVAMLGDGSRVSLDAATDVQVRMKDAARQVELIGGRAKFDVAKDPLRPFTVAAGDKLVVAVGTSFSVELVGGDVRVILYEGQVEVRDRSDLGASATKRRQMMTAGSELVGSIGSSGPGQVTRPDLSQSLSWEQGMINFENEPLANAIARVNRYSKRQIRLADPALGGILVDGVFKAGDLDAFLEGVTALHPVRRENAGTEILLERR